MSYQSDSLDNNTVAYASFLSGFASMFTPFIFLCCAPLLSIVAITCGVIYIVRHDKTSENMRDMVLSYCGIATGVLGLDILDNLIPFIRGEEERVQIETQKILGSRFPISCTCTRVPVLDGHTEVVNLVTQRAFSVEDISALWSGFRPSAWTALPSAPSQWIRVHDDPCRPQPRLDRDQDHGMTTHVGRISLDNALGEQGVRYVLLSHNTKMGAARGAVMLAEYMLAQGML